MPFAAIWWSRTRKRLQRHAAELLHRLALEMRAHAGDHIGAGIQTLQHARGALAVGLRAEAHTQVDEYNIISTPISRP